MLLKAIHNLFLPNPTVEQVDLSGQKILVTGASVGSLGFATARVLINWGASVVVTSRKNPELIVKALKEKIDIDLINAEIDAYPLDLSEVDSVVKFSHWYTKKHGERLNVLINNAGINLDLLGKWKEPMLSADGFEMQWRTNYLGTIHLTHLLLPILKKTGLEAGDARVVNVSSHMHSRADNQELFELSKPYNSWDAYGLSKLALIHSAFEIQRRYAKEFNLQGYCLHPGSVVTNIADRGFEGNRLVQYLRKVFLPIEALLLMTPEEGAQTQILCTTNADLQGGVYYERCKPAKTSLAAKDHAISVRLWDAAQAWVDALI